MAEVGQPVPAHPRAGTVLTNLNGPGVAGLATAINPELVELADRLGQYGRKVKSSSVVRGAGIRSRTNAVGFIAPNALLKRTTPRPASFMLDIPGGAAWVDECAARLWDTLRGGNPAAAQQTLDAAAGIHPDWRIAGTPWTSGVLNHGAALPYHYDNNNVPGTWSGMLWAKHPLVRGGGLHFPTLDLLIPCVHGAALFFCGHSTLHGVTPMTEPRAGDARRWSLVFYVVRKFVGLPGAEASLAANHRDADFGWVKIDKDDLASLKSEIAHCKAAQSWSPGSTRSGWFVELEEIVRYGLARVTDIEAAECRAEELAEDVARRLAEDEDEISGLRFGHTAHEGSSGYEVDDEGKVEAWATQRVWRANASQDYVTVPSEFTAGNPAYPDGTDDDE